MLTVLQMLKNTTSKHLLFFWNMDDKASNDRLLYKNMCDVQKIKIILTVPLPTLHFL